MAKTTFQSRAVAIVLVVMAGSVTWGPASAQYYWGDRSSGGWGGWDWGGRSSGDRYYRRSPHRDFLSPFSGERRNRPAPAVDYSKAPPARKLDKPPSQTVVVIGDSMADWLGYGLDEKYADQPETVEAIVESEIDHGRTPFVGTGAATRPPGRLAATARASRRRPTGHAKTLVDLCDFFYETCKNTPRDKLLE
jgi:hypothetical protein